MLYPFCFISFANSPTKTDDLDVSTASANNTLGFCFLIVRSACLRFSCSSFRLLASLISVSGLSSTSSIFSSVMYAPCFRIDGITSDVIHFLNFFASGLRSEEHTSELQSRGHLVCRLLLEQEKEPKSTQTTVHL